MTVPRDWPDSGFDLILLSEVVYYLDLADVDRLASQVAGSLRPAGDRGIRQAVASHVRAAWSEILTFRSAMTTCCNAT